MRTIKTKSDTLTYRYWVKGKRVPGSRVIDVRLPVHDFVVLQNQIIAFEPRITNSGLSHLAEDYVQLRKRFVEAIWIARGRPASGGVAQ